MDDSAVPDWEAPGEWIHWKKWANVTIDLERMSSYVYSGAPSAPSTPTRDADAPLRALQPYFRPRCHKGGSTRSSYEVALGNEVHLARPARWRRASVGILSQQKSVFTRERYLCDRGGSLGRFERRNAIHV